MCMRVREGLQRRGERPTCPALVLLMSGTLQGKYKDDGDASGVNANAAASYIGREWLDLAPVDADLPGGTTPA
jgi:hypothetical protein